MKVIAAMTLSVLVAFGAFGQGEDDGEGEGEDESAASPVCFNMNTNGGGGIIRAADAAADDVCFAPIEGYERYTPGDGSWEYHESDGFGHLWRVAVVQYLPKRAITCSTKGCSTGRAMKVEIVRWHHLPMETIRRIQGEGLFAVRSDSRTKGGFTQTFVWATLVDFSAWGKDYNVLKRTDAGTLVIEDCDYNPYASKFEGLTDAGADYPYAVVLGEGDDLRNVDRMVRRYLERLANPAVCTSAPCEEPFFACHGELPSPSCAAQHGAACGAS